MKMTRRRFAAFGAAAAAPLMSWSDAAAAQSGDEVLSRNRQLVTRYFEEVWNEGRVDLLDELLSPDYVNHTPSTANPPRGPEGLKPIVAAIRKGFPDLHFSIEDIIVTGDRAVARTIMTGTHRGDLFGMPPTGRRVAVNQINIEHIRDGRIVEHWRVTDELKQMRQLGLFPG